MRQEFKLADIYNYEFDVAIEKEDGVIHLQIDDGAEDNSVYIKLSEEKLKELIKILSDSL